MSRWRTAALSALAAALSVLVLAPGAYAQDGTVNISGVEMTAEFVELETLTATGTGVCAAVGKVLISVDLEDLETGGEGGGAAVTQCTAVGEHIKWAVGLTSNGVRPGDKAFVKATTAGAIDAKDAKIVTIKQFQ